MKLTNKSIVSLIIIVMMLVMIIMAIDFNERARMFPLGIGILILIMTVLQFTGEVFPRVTRWLPFLNQQGVFGDKKNDNDSEEKNEELDKNDEGDSWGNVFIIFLWLIGFVTIIYFTSYLVAIPLFLFLFIWLNAKEAFVPSVTVAIGVSIFMYVLFELILNISI